jgi:proto-oncogene tyrosine-protein kinase ROS
VTWKDAGLDLVRVNISRDVMPSSGPQMDDWYEFSGLSAETSYTLSFCAIHMTGSINRECGCYNFTKSTASEKVVNQWTLTSSQGEINVAWGVPNTPTDPTGYVVKYGPVDSALRDQMEATGSPVSISNVLPNTLYAVSVTSMFGAESFSSDENVTRTSSDPVDEGTVISDGSASILYDIEPQNVLQCNTSGLLFVVEWLLNIAHVTDIAPYAPARQFFYSNTTGHIFRVDYNPNDRFTITKQDPVINGSGMGGNISTLAYDPTNDALYWLKNNGQVLRQPIAGGSPANVISSVDQIQIDATYGYLYWSDASGVYRCSLNPSKDCRANSETVYNAPTTTFMLSKPTRQLRQLFSSQFAVLSTLDKSVQSTNSLSFSASSILERKKFLYFQNISLGNELWKKDPLIHFCSTPLERGRRKVVKFTSDGEDPFSPPNPPNNFNFEINSTHVVATWLSPSNGDLNYPVDAPWKYIIQSTVGSSGSNVTMTSLERRFVSPTSSLGTRVTLHVTAEGQKGHTTVSPQFMVVTSEENVPGPLLIGDEMGVYERTLGQTSSTQTSCPMSVKSITRDPLRDVTYVINSGGRIVRCGSGDFLAESVPIHSLSVDWVANRLYWIRTGTEIVAADVKTLSVSTVRSGVYETLQVDPLRGLLFYSTVNNVDFQKVNGLEASGNTRCSVGTDRVVALTLDLENQRVYWVTIKYSRLILNWADYGSENCVYRGWTVVPEVKLNSSSIGCGLSVNNGVLAIKVENIREVWTVRTIVFDVITVDSSPGLTRYQLDQRSFGAVNIAFSSTSVMLPGLTADSIVTPQGLTVAEEDGSSDLDTIIISWSLSPPFTLSTLVFDYRFTLTSTDGNTTSYMNLTSSTSLRLTNQMPYTLVEGTVEAFSLWSSTEPVSVTFRSSSDVPSTAVNGVKVSVYQSGPSSADLSAAVSWSKLTPNELRGEFVHYIVQVNETNLTTLTNSILLRSSNDGFQLMPNNSYVVQVFVVNNFGASSGSAPYHFNTFDVSPALGIIVVGPNGAYFVDENSVTVVTPLMSPLDYDALTRTYYGVRSSGVVAVDAFGAVDGERDIYTVDGGHQVVSLALDWVAKSLYVLTVGRGALRVVEVQPETSLPPVTIATMSFSDSVSSSTILPSTRTLFFVTGNGSLYSVDIASRTIRSVRSGRRKRQSCTNPLSSSVDIGKTVVVEGNTGRLWFSDDQSENILSCESTASGLCHCLVEINASSLNNQTVMPPDSISLDKERIYWTRNGHSSVYYVERNDRSQVLSLSAGSTAVGSLVVSSPGMQPLPLDSCLYVTSPKPTPREHNVTDTVVSIVWDPVQLPNSCTNSIPLPDYTVRLTSAQDNRTVQSDYGVSVVISELTPYTNYTVQVSARNIYTPANLVDSLYGPLVRFQTTEGVPSAPRNLNVSVYGTGALRVEWSAPVEINANPSSVQYMIRANGMLVNTVGDRQVKLTELDPGTQYTIEVSAFNLVSGTDEEKVGLSVTAIATTWALPPVLVETSFTTNTSALLQATFNSNHRAQIRQVLLQQLEDGVWVNNSRVFEGFTSQENYTVSGLVPYQPYSFRLLGMFRNLPDGSPFAVPGPVTKFTTKDGVPSSPKLRHGPAVNTLVWEALTPRSSGGILRLFFTGQRLDNGAPFEGLESYNGQTSYSLSSLGDDLVVGVRYNVTMIAENSIGRGEPSNSVEFTYENEGLTGEIIAAIAVCASVLIIVVLVLLCICAWCCCIHYQNLKHKEEIRRRLAYNRDYDEDIERLRILKFSRDDYRSREDYIFSGNDLEKLVKIPRDQIKLDSHIGQGAFGEVYSGTTAVDGEMEPVNVAIKVLHKDATEEQERSFLSEAIVMSHFNHENILKIIGVCVNNNPNFIIMELMEGGNLLEFMRGARRGGGTALLTPPELAKISLDVANGAKYLEALKFIHRDLAARNCLVSSKSVDRVVKIGDFGLAKDLYSAEYYRKEGQGLLPVRWMPPESLQEGLFTTKSDVWAFGVTLYEIWTLGFQPYPAKTNHEVFDLVIHGGRNERPEKCPNHIYHIMTQCWQHNPEDRPPFIQIVEKLRIFVDRLKTESVCIDGDSLEDPGEFERGDSNRSWIRGSLRDSIRRIRTSIHRQNSVRGVRRQSSFKGELSTNNGQAFKESGPI